MNLPLHVNLAASLAALIIRMLLLLATLWPATGGSQSITFRGPQPGTFDQFGRTVAALGNDRVLVGARLADKFGIDAGAAYLFKTNGTLLATLHEPKPVASDYFGGSVAALGADRIIVGAHLADVGAPNSGVAYLFTTNGTLVTTFSNPTPAGSDYFGWSVAGLGSDRVIVGAYLDDAGALDTGAAYLFDDTGRCLTTFNNPTPAIGDFFGWSVAALGTNQVLIGAPHEHVGFVAPGSAFLFNTNGTLITTFANPTPETGDAFGQAVAAVGLDRVLIGAPEDDRGFPDSGAAYLFDDTGKLLVTFANPVPAPMDMFGCSVAAVGTDRVLIGAYRVNREGFRDSGAAYLFRVDGTLLQTINHPSPFHDAFFGCSVASVGLNEAVVGAYGNAVAGVNSGAAYLIHLNSH